MHRALTIFLILGCADRPIPLGATSGSNGTNGGSNATNGGSNATNGGTNGSNGGTNSTTNSANGGTNGGTNSGGTNGTPATARLLSPISTSRVTTRRPQLRFDSTGTAGSPEIDLCGNRGCTIMIATLSATGDSATPTVDLPSGPVFWRVRTGAQTSATWEFFVGKTAWNGAGGQSGFVLDLDNDGLAEVAMTTNDGVQINGTVSAVLPSPDGNKVNFGYVLVAAGDLDGDGYGDLAVGECGREAKVNIWYGGPSFPGRTQAISSPDGMDGFGCRVAAAGDVNGDGYADLAVARVGQDFSGGLYIFAGGASGVAKTTTRIDSPDYKPSRNGYSLAGVGDLDGDGYDDVVSCEVDYSAMSGRAHVYRGGPNGLSNAAQTTLLSPDASGLQYGASVAGVGDVNGDGFPDFVVAAPASPMTTVAPLAHLFLGGSIPGDASGLVLQGNGATGFGSEVEAAGDLDGDGFADFVLTSMSNLALFRGSSKGAQLADSVDALSQGSNPRHLSGGADLDGDGLDDLIVVDGAGAELLPSGDRARAKTLGPATGAVAL